MLTPRNRIKSCFSKPSRTKQAPAREVDINYIVNRYLKTGQMPQATSAPIFGDMPSINLQDAYELIHNAESAFADLPAQTRAAFANNPLELLRALETEGNADLLIEHGILKKPAPEPPEAPPTVATLDVNSGSDTNP